MELTINFEKKYVYGISLILIVLIGIFSVRAYAYTTAIPSPGHGGDKVWIDVDPTDTLFPSDVKKGEKTLQDAINQGNFSERQGVPVRSFLTPADDCREHSNDPAICTEPNNPSNIGYLNSINLGIKTICVLRTIGEWNEGSLDTRKSECKIEKVGNEWIMSSDSGRCDTYCLNWE